MPEVTADTLGLDVSRETVDRLAGLVRLTEKWNKTINLISRDSTHQIWSRHIRDSLQLIDLAPAAGKWADLGSGGGYPALPIACHFAQVAPECQFHLVESDKRKAAFLITASRELGLNVVVHIDRIETCPPLRADVLSARAVAPLDRLLAFADRHLAPGGTCLFPKGEGYRQEVTDSLVNWRYDSETFPSKTHPSAAILKIWNITRA